MEQQELNKEVFKFLLYEIDKPRHIREQHVIRKLMKAIEELDNLAMELAFDEFFSENPPLESVITTEEEMKFIFENFNDDNEQFIK